MHGCKESDRFIVPRKPSNKGRPMGPAEQVEGRERAKGNLVEYHRGWTQGRETLPPAHDWVRQAPCACAFGSGLLLPTADAASAILFFRSLRLF